MLTAKVTMLAALLLPAASRAQTEVLTSSDSALIGRILVAEDRRDSTDAALRDGMQHSDPRVRVLAQRARGRISHPEFPARDSLPLPPPPVMWPEPAWRLRYRALAERRTDCKALGTALSDGAWPVRLRAADLVTISCATDDSLAAILRGWIA
ncbi:MAG: hypothetical protein H7Z74_06880, partial [Anaerolineae bacterium]|nr:hypothetical protein [Gemmatimonadaceae bacterium]